MAFERNDIVNKTRLAGELGEELMGFEHNDIVTVDVMNKAIEEGGGGGGGDTGTVWHVTINAVPMADTQMVTNKVEGSDGYGATLEVLPIYNGYPYYSLETSVDSGLSDFKLDYVVYDNYEPQGNPVELKIYYNAAYQAAVTGDIAVEHDEYDFIFTITGDGTITITAA